MLEIQHICGITTLSVICVLCSAVLVNTAMDFRTALETVRSQSVVMDIKEHRLPGPTLVSRGLNENQKAQMQSNFTEAVGVAMQGLERLARRLTGNDTYRRPDGLGNNIKNPLWGASMHTESRLLPNSYIDGAGLPRIKATSGNLLPNARAVSVNCFLPSREEKPFFDLESTQMLFQYGQFLDHDVIATSMEIAFGCCSNTEEDLVDTPCFTIPIDPGDRFFKGNCMNFRRAFGVIVEGIREQLNSATSFVDISTIYGANEMEITLIRQFEGGLLKVSADNMLPHNDFFPCVRTNIPACPLSGDSRVSEITGLAAIHLVYHREHNRLARRLARTNPHWSDERLFQDVTINHSKRVVDLLVLTYTFSSLLLLSKCKKINIAQHQNIVYSEFLPKVIGPDAMRVLGVDRPYQYDPYINPNIINVFGAAVFRFGHTLLNGVYNLQGNITQPLSELYFKPEAVLYQGEGILRDVVQNQARKFPHKFDRFFTTEITDKLYLGVDSEAEPGESFDLLARNIQRGRDHGLRPYIDYLDYCIERLRGIEGINLFTLPTCLRNGLYESIRDIDIFLGGIYETPLTGAIMGPTFACITGEQFYRLKHGDRFFYQTPDRSVGFTPAQLANIEETAKLSSILCRNTIINEMQPQALDSRRAIDNQKQPCSSFPDIDTNLWRERP